MASKNLKLALEGITNKNASLRDFQSIIIRNSIENCWKLLHNVDQWHKWNDNVNDITKNGKDPWKDNFSLETKSGSQEILGGKLDPPKLLAYAINGRWIKGNVVWKLEPADDNETIVTLEQSFDSLLVPWVYNHQRLHKDILEWLSRFKKTADNY